MKKDAARTPPSTPSGGKATAADHRVAQRHQKQSQAAHLSAANVEESPRMDRGDSAAGAGESLGDAPPTPRPANPPQRGALDTQYGTDSSTKVPRTGRASSGGSGSSAQGSGVQVAPDPPSTEDASGSERDTMSGPRPGRRP